VNFQFCDHPLNPPPQGTHQPLSVGVRRKNTFRFLKSVFRNKRSLKTGPKVSRGFSKLENLHDSVDSRPFFFKTTATSFITGSCYRGTAANASSLCPKPPRPPRALCWQSSRIFKQIVHSTAIYRLLAFGCLSALVHLLAFSCLNMLGLVGAIATPKRCLVALPTP
jgi:hypothetical protein